MPQVFTGKVVIPGNQIDGYFAALAEAEEARRPFREELERLRGEFEDHLSEKVSERTVNKHTGIVQLFIEFLCGYTDVQRLEEVTKGMANSQFRQWYKRKVWASTPDNDLKVAIRKFFLFLEAEKGIKNEKALSGLR